MSDVGVYCSGLSTADMSIDPGVTIKADPVMVDLETKQLESAARDGPLGATTSVRQTCVEGDDDDNDINNNVVLDAKPLSCYELLALRVVHRPTS